MGRPKVIHPRSQQLNLSFTGDEWEGIKRRAAALGVRPSAFGRSLLLTGHDGKPAMRSKPADPAPGLVHALSRLGNNLNQMVRHLHQTGDPLPLDLEPLLFDIRALIARLTT
jgi:hypothetical protein